jgi:hypothetical protein
MLEQEDAKRFRVSAQLAALDVLGVSNATSEAFGAPALFLETQEGRQACCRFGAPQAVAARTSKKRGSHRWLIRQRKHALFPPPARIFIGLFRARLLRTQQPSHSDTMCVKNETSQTKDENCTSSTLI